MLWQAGKVTMPRLTQRDFERLLEFRVTLRRFQRWSEDQAQAAGPPRFSTSCSTPARPGTRS